MALPSVLPSCLALRLNDSSLKVNDKVGLFFAILFVKFRQARGSFTFNINRETQQ